LRRRRCRCGAELLITFEPVTVLGESRCPACLAPRPIRSLARDGLVYESVVHVVRPGR
jgi:hypothetical protein